MVDINVPTNGHKISTAEDVDINVPTLKLDVRTKINKPSTPIIKPGPQIIAPGANHLQVDCIRCKGREFHISVKTLGDGSGSIRELICTGCNKIFKIDPNGALLAGGRSYKENK